LPHATEYFQPKNITTGSRNAPWRKNDGQGEKENSIQPVDQHPDRDGSGHRLWHIFRICISQENPAGRLYATFSDGVTKSRPGEPKNRKRNDEMMIIKFIPGIAGATAAYLVLKIFGWIQSFSFEILLFFCTYLIVTVGVDIAMKKYGEKKK
jgi:hypothetical protein